MSDVVVLKVMSKKNTYTCAIQGKCLSDKVALVEVSDKEVQTPMYAFHAGFSHRSLKGLDQRFNVDKQQRNFRDAMKALDKHKLGQQLRIRSTLAYKIRGIQDSKTRAGGTNPLHDNETRILGR